MWDVFYRHITSLAALWIPSTARLAVTQADAAEAPNLDPIPAGQRLTHVIEYGVDRKFHIPRRQMQLLNCQSLNQIRFRYCRHSSLHLNPNRLRRRRLRS